jgi:hypothetical protein
MRDGGLVGWGVIRPCRKGFKIGPLVADDRATAEVVLSALLASVGGGEMFLDVPSINRNAVALAQDLGLVPVFETARMYTGAILPLRLERYSASPPLSWGSIPRTMVASHSPFWEWLLLAAKRPPWSVNVSTLERGSAFLRHTKCLRRSSALLMRPLYDGREAADGQCPRCTGSIDPRL